MILQVREPTFSVGRQSVLHVAACSPSLSARSREARCSEEVGLGGGWTVGRQKVRLERCRVFLRHERKRKRKCMNMLDFTPHSRNMSYMWSSTEVHNWSMLKAAHKLKVWILWSWTLMCFFPRTVSCNIICFGCPGWWKCSTYHDVLQDVYYITIRIPTPQKLFFEDPKTPLLYRFKPLHWRVQGFLGDIIWIYISLYIASVAKQGLKSSMLTWCFGCSVDVKKSSLSEDVPDTPIARNQLTVSDWNR